MFSKNIKTLSLFLVLAVIMIVAAGAVSATDLDTSDHSAGTTDSVTVTPDNSVATGTVAGAGTINLNGTVTITNDAKSDDGKYIVPSGSAVNGTYTDSTGETDKADIVSGITLVNGNSSKIFYNNGTSYVDTGATFTGDTTVNANGVYTGTLTIVNSGFLTSGSTYYVNLIVPKDSTANTGILGTDSNYTTVSKALDNYVAFTYTGPTLSLDKDLANISYGDAWSFTGTLVNATNEPVVGQNVTYTLYKSGTTTALATATATTNSTGQFTIDSTLWNSIASVSDYKTIPASSDNYTLSFVAGGFTTNATIIVNNKNLKIDGLINESTINYGQAATINATLVDANGKTVTLNAGTLVATIINKATAESKTVNITYTNGKYAVAIPTDLVPGDYLITISAPTTTNYVINNSDVMTLTVKSIATNIVATPEIVNTTSAKLDAATGAIFTFITNTTTNKTDVSGTWSAALFKEDGTPVKTITFSTTTPSPTNSILSTTENNFVGLADGNYYVYVTFTPTTPAAYTASNTTVYLVVKKVNTIGNNYSGANLKYDLGTTGNATYVNVTSSPVDNVTVTVYVDNKSIGTVEIINGSSVVDFGKLALGAGTHNVTFAYAGNDTYLPNNATMKIVVNPKDIGNLKTNTTTINGVTINSVNKTFTLNLTNATNASQLIDYTGDVTYTVNGVTGTVKMTNGVAIVDAKTLNGLSNGRNTVAFQINNNYTSNTVNVNVYASRVTADIIANNISTNNATPITITGTVVNATEGNVIVYLKNNKNVTIATVSGTVAADGTFTVAFGNYANGVYSAEINYTSSTGLSSAATKNVTVTVNGTAPTPVVGNVTTNLTINTNFTEAYGEGLNLTGKLTDANGNPIVGQHIALNLTNPATGASKIYWVTTDTNGEYQLQINLFVGSYTASASYGGFTTADNTTTYLPSGPVNGTITVTNGTAPVDNRTATVLAFSNFTEKYGQALNFTGTLKTTNGTAIVGQKIALELFNKAGQSKVYWRTTDTDGAVQLPIELLAGDYTFKCSFAGDSTYQASNNQTGSITVTA